MLPYQENTALSDDPMPDAEQGKELSPYPHSFLQPNANGEGYHVNELARFRALAAAVCSSICVSMIFAFGLVSDFMRDNYNYDQRDLTTISTVGLVVGFFTFPFGALYDYAGVLPLFIMGTILTLLGPLLFALTFAGVIAPSVALLSIYNALLNLGCGIFDVGSVLVLMDLFPRNRGPVIGIVKTMTGLGSSVLAAIYSGFFNSNNTNYMYFMMAMAVLFGFIVCSFIRLPKYVTTGYEASHCSETTLKRKRLIKLEYMTKRPPIFRIVYAYAVVVILLLFLTVTSIVDAYITTPKNFHLAKAVVTAIIVVLFAVMALPFSCMGGMEKSSDESDSNTENGKECEINKGNDDIGGSLHNPPINNETVQMCNMDKATLTEDTLDIFPRYNTSFWHGLLAIDSWCVFWCSLWAWGAGLTMILNVSQIYQSLYPSSEAKTASLYVALNGVGSAVGRLMVGAVEAYLTRCASTNSGDVQSAQRSITISYPVGSLLILIGYVLFLALPGKAVVVASFITASGYGFSAACTAVLVPTIWSKDSGKYYNLCFLGAMISGVLLNRFLFGELYDNTSKKNGTYPNCVGRNCVQTCFIVMIAGCVTAVAAALVVHLRFNRFVQKTYRDEMNTRSSTNNQDDVDNKT